MIGIIHLSRQVTITKQLKCWVRVSKPILGLQDLDFYGPCNKIASFDSLHNTHRFILLINLT